MLIILASVAIYTGTQTIRYTRFSSAKYQMELMQANVNSWYEKSKYDDSVLEYGESISSLDGGLKEIAKDTFDGADIDAIEQDGYKYFSYTYLKDELDVDGISYDFLIDIQERNVLLFGGISYDGKIYYTNEHFEIDNVQYEDKIGPIVKLKVEETTGDSITVSVKVKDRELGMPENPQYTYYIKSVNDEEYGTASARNITESTYTFEGLDWGEYDIKVETMDNNDNVGWSEEIGCVVKELKKPVNTNNTIEVNDTNYATIDVIWLDTDNDVISRPNAPRTTSDMTKVTWTFDDDLKTWSEDTSEPTTNAAWYNYVAGDGKTDTKTSRWANVKLEDGSYFVWIPRYAYRITYYSDEEMTDVTGYFDGYGFWSKHGTLKYKLNEDVGKNITTVLHNGKKYIVHPAFETDLDNGGWSSDLAGIWVAKYEMSQQSSTDGNTWTNVTAYSSSSAGDRLTTNAGNTSTTQYRAVSIPDVSSWRYATIGNQYLNGYNYDRAKESHMMKNSEWGAVAYLTQSQYGRNAHEIDINNSSDYITGNGGGSTNASSASGITNAYNTETGAKASTTGNIYGIYDMSGGALEKVALYDSNGSSDYLDEASYGKAMVDNAKDGEDNYISTKYITKYTNPTGSYKGTETEKLMSKIGDALIEVNKYIGSSHSNIDDHLFVDYSYLASSSHPFFERGGSYSYGSNAGVFCSHYATGGYGNVSYSWRVCIAL